MQQDGQRFVEWLNRQIIVSARGDDDDQLTVQPRGRYWLGRLTSEDEVVNSPFGDRSERMEPCAVGIRIKPDGVAPWSFNVVASACAWWRDRTGDRPVWRKSNIVSGNVPVHVPNNAIASHAFPATELARGLEAELGVNVLAASIRVDVERGRGGSTELVVSLVNESPEESPQLDDTGLYQVEIGINGVATTPFLLESLPDSFRYDRRVPAFGINCGVEIAGDGAIRSTDVVQVDRPRPRYWAVETPAPDCSFATLAEDPMTSLRQLKEAHESWGREAWSAEERDRRADEESWSDAMRQQAERAAQEFNQEAERIRQGLEMLESNADLRRSFRLMNAAMQISSRGRYTGWRPFQLGFLLANLNSILMSEEESSTVDILWFATGGGKTETYLGLLVMAAFHDRITGKHYGMTAWSRFPLRLLSLQQTQRFADAVAAAELIRRRESIPGDSFSMGFFVGDSSTPNRIKLDPSPGEPDRTDPSMPARYQVLLRCPFCDHDTSMHFDHQYWRLEHRCENDVCPWPEQALPIYIVDEEIFRFLPTIIVGTLDKVALISMQAAMRGFIAAPYGQCSEEGHGFTYAPRSARPQGCLVPGCNGTRQPLPIASERFAPTFRLQDELHLLRDSLGAIDAHYESLLDHLEAESSGVHPKIVASSATLTGYERQCDVLYRRSGRVFPVQGPRASLSFWSAAEDENLLRKYVALAPRGATLEFAADRLLTVMQQAVRRLLTDPDTVCAEAGVNRDNAGRLLSIFGTNVVYGNTIRDIDACARSLETQVPVQPLLTTQLTGHTPFEEVRQILERLESPEDDFNERIHVVAASSMMSHGVDIDRLNTMVMLGHPLTTAEFMQATARIGRTYPGLIYVLHKMPLERDASLFRSFKSFVEQGDRFVEAVPITRRSRRVLERTLPGLMMARLLHFHEFNSAQALTVIQRVRNYFNGSGVDAMSELQEIIRLLQIDTDFDHTLRTEAEQVLRNFFSRLNDPADNAKWTNELFAHKVMRSLRDVEEQAPIYD